MQAKTTPPLITDRLLAELATPDAQASMGNWDEKTCALLAAAIPEMATELLRCRELNEFRRRRYEREQSAARTRIIARRRHHTKGDIH